MHPFIEAIVGEEGAQALKKAAEINKNIEFAIWAKTILTWIELAGNNKIANNIPGTDIYIEFQKTESGYCGIFKSCKFENLDEYQLSGIIAVSLNLDESLVTQQINNKMVKNIEKSINLLAKTYCLNEIKDHQKTNAPKWWKTTS